MERELKRRTKNLANHNAADNEDDEEDLDEEDRENLANEKLLNRLYRAADIEHSAAVRFEGVDSKEGDQNNEENVIDQQNRALIMKAQ